MEKFTKPLGSVDNPIVILGDLNKNLYFTAQSQYWSGKDYGVTLKLKTPKYGRLLAQKIDYSGEMTNEEILSEALSRVIKLVDNPKLGKGYRNWKRDGRDFYND